MCYFCHNLNNNPSAPKHRTKNCIDPRNNLGKYKVKPTMWKKNGIVFVNGTYGSVKAAFCQKCCYPTTGEMGSGHFIMQNHKKLWFCFMCS